MNAKKRLRLSLFGYIQALLFSAVLLIFINGEAGWGMIYIISAAIAASVVVFVVSHRRFTVECSSFSGLYRKGDTVSVELIFKARGFCVLPFITVNGSLMGQPFTARCALIGKTSRVNITATAEQCGLGHFLVDELLLRDSLGLITYRSDIRPEGGAAAVLPDIVEYAGPEVLPSALPSDNDEEAEEGSIAGGTPGYEHRGYQPGDPLNRINYKLSAKKRSLVVRREENTSAQSTDIEIAAGSDGACLEQALALAKRLVSLGGAARVVCGADSFSTASPAAVDRLREWLAFRDLTPEELSRPLRTAGAAGAASLSRSVVTISAEGFSVQQISG